MGGLRIGMLSKRLYRSWEHASIVDSSLVLLGLYHDTTCFWVAVEFSNDNATGDLFYVQQVAGSSRGEENFYPTYCSSMCIFVFSVAVY